MSQMLHYPFQIFIYIPRAWKNVSVFEVSSETEQSSSFPWTEQGEKAWEFLSRYRCVLSILDRLHENHKAANDFKEGDSVEDNHDKESGMGYVRCGEKYQSYS